MKKFGFVVAISMVMMAIVSCKPAAVPQTAEGLVMKADVNSVMVVNTAGDTLNISIMGADTAKIENVLFGEQVRVTYLAEKEGRHTELKATELTVIRHIPRFYINGMWLEPTKTDPTQLQGMNLKRDGVAEAVNMKTQVFSSWQLTADNHLILKGQLIGKKKMIDTVDTLMIVKISEDSLVLSLPGGDLWKLRRSN